MLLKVRQQKEENNIRENEFMPLCERKREKKRGLMHSEVLQRSEKTFMSQMSWNPKLHWREGSPAKGGERKKGFFESQLIYISCISYQMQKTKGWKRAARQLLSPQATAHLSLRYLNCTRKAESYYCLTDSIARPPFNLFWLGWISRGLRGKGQRSGGKEQTKPWEDNVFGNNGCL